MTDTEITPIHPFQDEPPFLKTDQRLDSLLDKKNSFMSPELASTKSEISTFISSPCPSLSTITSSSPSSLRNSRIPQSSIWNNNNTNSSDASLLAEFSCLPSMSPIWSNSLCDLPMALNKNAFTTTTQTNPPSSPRGYQQPSPNYLRNIWCSPSMTHQPQPSHYRRMSLSDYNFDDRSTLVSETQHTAKGDVDQMNGFGRRHSVAGPFALNTMNKSTTNTGSSNGHRRMQNSHWSVYPSGSVNDSSMNAIDEDETFIYTNAQYSRYQQHILNKGILDHIDEYFGGGNSKKTGGGVPDIDTIAAASTIDTKLPQPYLVNAQGISPTKTPPSPTTTTTTTTECPEVTSFGKTMTAGGDAIAFGCSNLLMGKGIPLHHFLDSNTLLYLVEFKTSRTDICYIMQKDAVLPQIGDLVITEADRGRDLGKVMNILTANTIIQKQRQQGQPLDDKTDGMELKSDYRASGDDGTNEGDPLLASQQQQKYQVKRLYRLANADETASLTTKQLDEENALLVCQAKIEQKKIPMQVVNAEYQWDRRKLTFYFVAEQRIDFRELVRELFKTYKTRIWMCALKSNANDKIAAF